MFSQLFNHFFYFHQSEKKKTESAMFSCSVFQIQTLKGPVCQIEKPLVVRHVFALSSTLCTQCCQVAAVSNVSKVCNDLVALVC